LTELQRIDQVMRGLKGIAMKLGVPVMAVAAADEAALRRQRVHFEDLWGPATVQYEPDVAIVLNRDAASVEEQRTVRIAIEKNRHGPSDVEFQHVLAGEQYRLTQAGQRLDHADSFQVERILPNMDSQEQR
jgi:replicative DNA helicase